MAKTDDEKAARLAAALRENLRRRKGRERAVDAISGADASLANGASDRPPVEDDALTR